MEMIGLDLHKRERQLSIKADDWSITDRGRVFCLRRALRANGWPSYLESLGHALGDGLRASTARTSTRIAAAEQLFEHR